MWTNYLLTRVETATVEKFATPLGFKIRKFIKPVLRPILRLASGRRIHVNPIRNWKKEYRTYSYPPTSLWMTSLQITLLLTDWHIL